VKPLEVWAPDVGQAELVSDGNRYPLDRTSSGQWQPRGVLLPNGANYGFSLDGGAPLPDPRSREQPEGVHGPSRLVEADFPWTDQRFRARPLACAVIYELHVGTFAQDGTFDGVIARLPHLAALGVTHVEIMPLAEFPGAQGWGYDGVYLYAPHRAYGGVAGLKRLVDACHARDIAVLLDVVYNHLGPDGNVLPRFGPYLTDRHHTPWGAALNLDGEGSREVRRFLLDNALHWLEEYHIDGLRLDAVHELHDCSARHFLAQLADEVAALSERLGKPLDLIAESDLNDPRLIRAPEVGGFGLDAQWSDDFHHVLHVVLTGERQGYYADFGGLADLARVLESGFLYTGQYSEFRKRCHGQPLDKGSLRRLVGYLQNHDQVGNRARGERIGQLASARRAKLGAAIVLLGPFIPLIFQGEEWNASTPFLYFTDHQDEALARATRDGRRREFSVFGWRPDEVPDPQAPETFHASRLDFAEIERPEHAAMLGFYRELIRLRRERPELATACVEAQHDESRGFFSMDRAESRVALNFGNETLRAPQPHAASFEVVHATEGAGLDGETLVLPPESVAVVVRRS